MNLRALLGPLPQRSPAYRPEIDGLRAVAVIAVLINHLNGAAMPGGYLGVDIFFAISGYVVTASLLSRKDSINKNSFYQQKAKLPDVLPSKPSVPLGAAHDHPA